MARKKKSAPCNGSRRRYTEDFKEEAVQMLLDGHTAPSVKDRLGLSSVNLLYRWKREQLAESGPVARLMLIASTGQARIHQASSHWVQV